MHWTSLPWILAASLPILAGCQPALLEERNDLREQVDQLQGKLQTQEDRIHELERELDGCEAEVDRKAVREVLDEVNVDPARPLFAVLRTSEGAIRVELFPAHAPRTVASFVGLAEGTRAWTDPRTGALVEGKPLFRDLLFHRVIAGYVIQTGDPVGDGTGTPGYSVPDEISDELWYGEPGMLGMANSGPDSNGSQFFITLDAARHLNGRHTLFGRVVEGMDVVQAISLIPAGTTARFRPDRDVLLQGIVIERG